MTLNALWSSHIKATALTSGRILLMETGKLKHLVSPNNMPLQGHASVIQVAAKHTGKAFKCRRKCLQLACTSHWLNHTSSLDLTVQLRMFMCASRLGFQLLRTPHDMSAIYLLSLWRSCQVSPRLAVSLLASN